MRPDRDEADAVDVELVGYGSDGRERMESAPRWDSTPAIGVHRARPASGTAVDLLMALAVLVVCAGAVVAAGLAQQHRHRTITTVRRQNAPVALAVDAGGCPLRTSCTITATPQPEMVSAVKSWDPRIEVDAGNVVLDAEDTPVRSTLQVRLAGGRRAGASTHLAPTSPAPTSPAPTSPGPTGPVSLSPALISPVTISIVSECIARGSAVPGSVRTAQSTGHNIVAIVVPGARPGCSVAVVATSAATLQPLVATLTRWAHNPALQL